MQLVLLERVAAVEHQQGDAGGAVELGGIFAPKLLGNMLACVVQIF